MIALGLYYLRVSACICGSIAFEFYLRGLRESAAKYLVFCDNMSLTMQNFPEQAQ
jgi:hypothetical protein